MAFEAQEIIPRKPLMIHLIEDDDDHAGIVTRLLLRAGAYHQIERSRDGAEAIVSLEKKRLGAIEDLPDLILLDLKLPKKDGHEILKYIKEDPILHTIPVVILSTSDAEIDRKKAYELYANSYLVKPLELGSFRKLTEDIVKYWGVWNMPATERREAKS